MVVLVDPNPIIDFVLRVIAGTVVGGSLLVGWGAGQAIGRRLFRLR